MNDNDVLVSVHDACRIYRMGEVDVHALREANLDVRVGEMLVVVGPSGSGKSTLLNLIGGMDRPTSGSVRYLGRELASASERDLTLYRRNRIGFVFQFYNLVPTLTARENVEVAAELVPEPMDVREALRLVGLEDRMDHFPAQLSGGEQQRVAIARALVRKPALLLCDEPTGALDLETSRQILALLGELRARLKTTVVLITHNGAIAHVANRVAHMRDGQIVSVDENTEPLAPEKVTW